MGFISSTRSQSGGTGPRGRTESARPSSPRTRPAPPRLLECLRPLLDRIPAPLLLVEVASGGVEANPAAAVLLGLGARERSRIPLAALSPGRDLTGRVSPEVLAEAAAKAARAGKAVVGFRFERGETGPLDAELELVPIVPGDASQLLAVVRPLAATAVAGPALPDPALVGQLASGMAHSMNNLLAVIQGRLDLGRAVASADPGSRLADHLRKANETVARASVLSRRLQMLAGRGRVEPRLLLLNDLIGAIAARQETGPSAPVDVRVCAAPDLVRVTADPDHVERALVALVERGLRSMPAGGVLEIRTANVDVGPDRATATPWLNPGRYASIEVRDSGEPIPAFRRPRIFDPAAGDAPRLGAWEIDLQLVYAIVKNYHGYVEFESLPHRGSAFRLLFPESIEPRDADHERRARRSPDPMEGKTVLVVEDDDVVREMVATVLREQGLRVFEARTAVKAEEEFARNGDSVDLLLTDILLPGGNGRELAESFRRARPGLKVVFTSGYASESLPSEVAPDPTCTFVPKPFKLRDLVGAIRSLIG